MKSNWQFSMRCFMIIVICSSCKSTRSQVKDLADSAKDSSVKGLVYQVSLIRQSDQTLCMSHSDEKLDYIPSIELTIKIDEKKAILKFLNAPSAEEISTIRSCVGGSPKLEILKDAAQRYRHGFEFPVRLVKLESPAGIRVMFQRTSYDTDRENFAEEEHFITDIIEDKVIRASVNMTWGTFKVQDPDATIVTRKFFETK